MSQTLGTTPTVYYNVKPGTVVTYKVTKATGYIQYPEKFILDNGSQFNYVITNDTTIQLKVIGLNNSSPYHIAYTQISMNIPSKGIYRSETSKQFLMGKFVSKLDFANILLYSSIIPNFPNETAIYTFFNQPFAASPIIANLSISEKVIVLSYTGRLNGITQIDTFDRNSNLLIESELINSIEGSRFNFDYAIKLSSPINQISSFINKNILEIILVPPLVLLAIITAIKYTKYKQRTLKMNQQASFKNFLKQSKAINKSRKKNEKRNVNASLEKIEEILQENEK